MRISTTSTKMRSSAAAWIAGLALSFGLGAATADAQTAQALIEQTVDQVIAILKDQSRPTGQRLAELEEIAHQRFDFRTMARLVLGGNWKRLKPPQRDEFVDQFTIYLANDYGSRLERYEQEEVKVFGEEPKPRGDVVVKTKILGGRNDGTTVDYRMRKLGEEWRIIDVVIEGISLVANFRDQFKEVIARGGPEALLQQLKQKNAAAEKESG
jgi:phospholipid transport system substrate-binding protein